MAATSSSSGNPRAASSSSLSPTRSTKLQPSLSDFTQHQPSSQARRVVTRSLQSDQSDKPAAPSSSSSSASSDGELPEGSTGSGLLSAMFGPIAAVAPTNPHPSLINSDFAPTLKEQRMLSLWDMASLWVGLVVGVPSWYLAGGLVELGMSWWQGVLTVFAGNLIVLFPMLLAAHPGCKYGIPFPVLSRAAFGIYGANVPSILRALVACGWFGIQTWIGGQAVHALVGPAVVGSAWGASVPWLVQRGVLEGAAFAAFWLLQVGIIWNGIESIKKLEAFSAPILIALSAALLGWAYVQAGGFGPMLHAPSQFAVGGPKAGQFWSVFVPSLTANVGFWATLSLNIPDFTRFAKSQRDQVIGQSVGLPLFMAMFTFVGLAVTSATIVIYGSVISDPILLLSKIKGIWPQTLAIVGLTLATLTTNIAANVVAPSNAFINLFPSKLTFRSGGIITAILGVVFAPWKLMNSAEGFIFKWLIGYSALLGPIGGVLIADYYLVRRMVLNVDALYSLSQNSEYWYSHGYNIVALLSIVAGMVPSIPGFLHVVGIIGAPHPMFLHLYNNAWMLGFMLAAIVYWTCSIKLII